MAFATISVHVCVRKRDGGAWKKQMCVSVETYQQAAPGPSVHMIDASIRPSWAEASAKGICIFTCWAVI